VASDAAARVAARAILGARRETAAAPWVRPLLIAAGLAAVLGGSLMLRSTPRTATAPITASTPRTDAPALVPAAASPQTTLRDLPRPIVFSVRAPTASVVRVVGDFNAWSRDTHQMHRDADGVWRLTALVPPGRYVFAYLVDGQRWVRDEARAPVEDSDFGITGSELIVGAAP
jgi:hypothetical protein